jgi:hypothetical protein
MSNEKDNKTKLKAPEAARFPVGVERFDHELMVSMIEKIYDQMGWSLPKEPTAILDTISSRLSRMQMEIDNIKQFKGKPWDKLILAAKEVSTGCLQLLYRKQYAEK